MIKRLDNEPELLAALADRDHHAFRQVFDHYHQNVHAFALWYLKSEDDAEEVVQETFLRLWLLGREAREVRDLQKYLRTIAGNKALDLLRYNARRLSVSAVGDALPEPIHNETEEAILLNDFKALVEQAVANLPEQQRRVYLLCHEEGMKNDQAAEMLNLSPLTVRTHMKLALRSLRAYIRKHGDGADLMVLLIVLKFF